MTASRVYPPMQTTEETTDRQTWIQTRSLLVFAAATALVAWLGSMATQESVDSQWFESLDKPAFYPPREVNAIELTVL